MSDPALAAVFQTLPGASFIVNGATPATTRRRVDEDPQPATGAFAKIGSGMDTVSGEEVIII